MRRRWPLWQRILFAAEAAALLPFYLLAVALPLDVGSAVGGAIARVIGPRLPISRRARHTIRLAFPDACDQEVERILTGMYDNYGRVVFEYPHIKEFWDEQLYRQIEAEGGIDGWRPRIESGEMETLQSKRIEVVGLRNYLDMYYHDGPVVIFSAHLGNFEIMPLWTSRVGMPAAVLFRTPNNPYVARLIEFIRRGNGELIPKGLDGALRTTKVLEAGGRLGMLVDQKQNRGIEVPFFGLPAMTATAAAKLALRYDAPIHGAWVERTGGAYFRIHITPALERPAGGTEAERIRALTARMNEEIEQWVRQAPEQWLWLHQRWPKGL